MDIYSSSTSRSIQRPSATVMDALMDFVEQRAHELGLREIKLYTHEGMTENIEIYEHLGYSTFRDEDLGDPRAVWMSKRLDSSLRCRRATRKSSRARIFR